MERISACRMIAASLVTGLAGPPALAQDEGPQLLLADPGNVSQSTGLSQSAALAVDAASGVYIAWEEGGARLLFARSVDDGKSFTIPKDIVLPGPGFSPGQVDLVTSGGGALHTVFTAFDTLFGAAEVLYVRTKDAGDTFESPVVVSTIDSFNSVVAAIDSGWAVAVAWLDTDLDTGVSRISYRQSLDEGKTFSPALTLSEGRVSCPDVVLSGSSSVYVSWPQGVHPSEDIFFSRSTDGGITFSPPLNISDLPEKSWCPRMAVDEAGTLYVAWLEGPAFTGRKVLLARSTDGGLSFTPPELVSDPAQDAFEVQVAATGGGVYVTWMTGSLEAGFDCSLVVSTDGAATFSAPAHLPGCGAIAARGARGFRLAWHEPPPGQSFSDIFHARGEWRSSKPPLDFYTVSPCRMIDTRGAEGPSLAANSTRVFQVVDRCDVPGDAAAVALNVTVALPSDVGHLRLYPAGGAIPLASTVNFTPGRTRANNTIVSVGLDGGVTVRCVMPPDSSGTTDLVMDVVGYFR
jgi:hypothetical protein